MLGSFLIFAREGIEGTLICAILLMFLNAAGRRELFRWVFAGAGAAAGLATAAGIALWIVSRDAFVGSQAQAWFETVVFGLAVVILTYMTFWMRSHARTMGARLRERAAGAVEERSGIAVFAIAFATVGREAVETVIFLVAIAYQSSPLQLGVGAAAGLGLALAVSVAMYRMGVHVHIGRLFTIVGSLLLVVAAGLLANAIQNLQMLGVLPGRSMTVWDVHSVLPDSSGVGDVLHGLLGYTASPSLLQLLAWVLFLAIGLGAFLRPARPAPPRPTAAAAA